jgi:hypothetical protein
VPPIPPGALTKDRLPPPPKTTPKSVSEINLDWKPAAKSKLFSPVWLTLMLLGLLLPSILVALISRVAAAAAVSAAAATTPDGHAVVPPGHRVGILEVASSGISLVVCESTKTPGEFKRVHQQNISTQLIDGMNKTSTFDRGGLLRATTGLKDLAKAAVTEHKVLPQSLFVVAADGIFGPIKKRADLEDKVKAELIEKAKQTITSEVKNAVDRPLDFASLREVARYQIQGTVRSEHLNSALFADIGSGSARIAYREIGGSIEEEELTGSRKYVELVKARKKLRQSFPELATNLSRDHLVKPFQATLAKNTEFAAPARDKVYMVGGIVWVMANIEYPQDNNDYVRISNIGIQNFVKKVRANPQLLQSITPNGRLSADEITQMRTAFKDPEVFVAGTEILGAYAGELKLDNKDVWFYRHSLTAWLVPYFQERYKPEYVK